SRNFVIPPLNTGKREGKHVHFDLNMQFGDTNFIGNATTPTLGIDGDFLGPVLRAQRGDTVSFAVKNKLDFNTTLHWHGFILPADMDGGPHQEIKPGETWQPEFNIIQPASTNWYHSHQHNQTGEQVYRGLAGMFIVDDEVSLNAGLPTDYGVDDIPVVIQDRSFQKDGSFRYMGSMMDRPHGMIGNTILVNGIVTPTLKAQKQALRLRILNGSNARIYDLAFHDARPFVVIAADGGFLPAPEKTQSIRLAPGERAEILVDLSDGRDAILANRPIKAQRGNSGGMMGNMGGRMMGMMEQDQEAFNVMRIQAPANTKQTQIQLPSRMLALPDWQNTPPATTRQFELQMQMGPRMMRAIMSGGKPFSISGASMDMSVVNHRVKANSVELWEISNPSMRAHPFHVHNTQFIVLDRSSSNGQSKAITATEKGLKDTVLVSQGETVRILVPFPEYSNSEILYMYHCHILEHEDAGMMGQFTAEA
ncbi:MAG: multicopper oxidase domain-containing protein, partial [Methylococcales bacterium]|nr:multicopper oxidase domain-containing protein [Methylococcales bacterium]